MANIYTMDGNTVTEGLQGCNVCDEAIQCAQRAADRLGTDVHLVDDDGEWIVHPAAADGTRAPADRHVTITTRQVEMLRDEAAAHGDLAQVEVCDRAMEGDGNALSECQRVIQSVAAQED